MTFRYITHANEARTICAQLTQHKIVGVDIETYPLASYSSERAAGLDPYCSKIRLVSVATRAGEQYIFDMHHLSPPDIGVLAQMPWAAHNAGFEYRHLKHNGYALPEKLHDTMLMGRPLYGENLSLADLSKVVLQREVDKTLQLSQWYVELSNEQLRYAAKDAQLAIDLAYRLLPQLDQEGLRPVYELYRKVIPIIGDQMLRGLHFDWAGHEALCRQWAIEQQQNQIQLQQLLGGINFRSTKQLSKWLMANLAKDVAAAWPKTATGILQTSAEALAAHAHLPIVQPLLRYKTTDKLLGTYGTGYAKHRHQVTGRIHPDLLIAGTAGGRFACRNPNVQNPPRQKAFRALFSAPPGRVLVAADFSQMELRVAALLAGEKRMLSAYEKGEDLHRLTAAAIAGIKPEDVDAAQRQAAKAVNFGNLYRQRPSGLVRVAKSSYGVEMTKAAAADMQHKFFTAYPDLYRWQLQQINTARVYGTASTRMGLIRRFDNQCGYLEATACNHPIQGSANEVLLAALARLPECLGHCDAHLYNHVHDEILIEAAEQSTNEVIRGLQQSMRRGFLDVFPDAGRVMNDVVEVRQGRDWSSVK
jgi:DNA polymerase-1